MLKSLTHAERVAKFGSFKFAPRPRPGNPEAIAILDNWAVDNIRAVDIPDPKRPRRTKRVDVHYKTARRLGELWREWERLELLQFVHTTNGFWVPRFKRGKRAGAVNLSNHSWGTAFDINAAEHPLGVPVPGDHPLRWLVPVAEAYGFAWGGNFSRPDGMHFEDALGEP